MDKNNLDDDLPQPSNSKVYAGYKVSDYSTGKGRYQVDEPEIEQRKQQKQEFFKQLESDADLDYKKKHKLGKDQQQFKSEYQSTRQALKEFSPFQWKRQLEYVKGLTPEEYEAVLDSVNEFKLNAKYYSFAFTGLSLGFTYWQRTFLPRGFYPFSVFMGCFAGCMYATLKTGWYFVEKIDRLGKDYEISRVMKQDIFDTRPDLDSGMRAQYYQHQQNERDK